MNMLLGYGTFKHTNIGSYIRLLNLHLGKGAPVLSKGSTGKWKKWTCTCSSCDWYVSCGRRTADCESPWYISGLNYEHSPTCSSIVKDKLPQVKDLAPIMAAQTSDIGSSDIGKNCVQQYTNVPAACISDTKFRRIKNLVTASNLLNLNNTNLDLTSQNNTSLDLPSPTPEVPARCSKCSLTGHTIKFCIFKDMPDESVAPIVQEILAKQAELKNSVPNNHLEEDDDSDDEIHSESDFQDCHEEPLNKRFKKKNSAEFNKS